MEGFSILDNVMISIEVINAFKRRTSGNKTHLALKIYISKAYDRVDLDFLRSILKRLGFDEKGIHWMMMYVTSMNYSVLVNSDSIRSIILGRGF